MSYMNIKEAAGSSGVSSQNIRFYEREGLIRPERDPNNSYRIYTQRDLHDLKLIRMLRMLDMPLEEIRLVLEQKRSLAEALQDQEERLHARERELQAALRFCRDLRASSPAPEDLDVDACLRRMEETPPPSGFFTDWVRDYKRVAAAQHREEFTFVPDGPVTTPREFTDALLAWAADCGKDIVIIKEGMYPHFTIDGAEYEAERIYRRIGARYVSAPLAIIRCHLCGADETDAAVSPWRRRLLRILRCALPGMILFALILSASAGWLFAPGQSWKAYLASAVFVIGMAVMCGLSAWFNYYYHFNDRTRQ